MIAGTDYSGCRTELVDAGDFKIPFAGSVDWANDALPHVQGINRGVKGVTFGITMVSANIAAISATRDAINAAMLARTTFEIEVVDGDSPLYDIHVNGVIDLSKDWLTHGKQSEGWYESLVWRFIAKTAM